MTAAPPANKPAQDITAQFVKEEPPAAKAVRDPYAPIPIRPRPPLDPRSSQCNAHEECILVHDECAMGFGVVNKAYAANWRAANRNDDPNCKPLYAPGELEAKNTPVCLNNTCGNVPHPPGQGPKTLPR